MGRTVSFLSVDKKGRATLPEDVRSALGVSTGDLVLLERTHRGTYELVPAALVPRDQLWFHHPRMQARVAEAEASFASGRSTRTDTPEAAQAFLDRLKKNNIHRRLLW
jgi:AbrB family looped-hinge helix DNA binding protein